MELIICESTDGYLLVSPSKAGSPAFDGWQVDRGASTMDYRTLETLRRTHPSWRLLVADNAPLVASFLHQGFIQSNIRSQPQ